MNTYKTSGEGSNPSQTDLKDPKEAKKYCMELVGTLDDLQRDKKYAQDLLKCRERELEDQRILVTFHRSESEKLLKENLRLESQVKSLEMTHESQQKENAALIEKVAKLEDLVKKKENESVKYNKELHAKHIKLRAFVKSQLAVIQALTKSVKSGSNIRQGAQLRKHLTSRSAKFTKRLKKMEVRRQSLLHRVRKNRQMICSLTKMLGTPRIVVKLQCRCGKSFPSEKKLQIHHQVVHTVQKARNVLQKISYARRKQISRLIKQRGFIQSKVFREAVKSNSEMGNNLQRPTNRKVQSKYRGTREMTTISASTVSPKPKRKNLKSSQQCSLNIQANPEHPKLGKKLSPFGTTWKHEADPLKLRGFHCRCGSSYGKAKALESHIKWFTADRKFVCAICCKRFVYLSNLKQHMENSHKKSNLSNDLARGCSDCGVFFASRKELEKHRRTFHSSNTNLPLSSPQPCGSHESSIGAQDNPTSFFSIRDSQFTPPPIQSSVPTTQTTQVWKTRCHAFSHAEKPGIYGCKCGLRFESMDTLDIHARFFVFGKRFPCSQCDELFPALGDVNTHSRKVHRETMPKSTYVGCNTCGVVFAERKEYRKHLVAPGQIKYNQNLGMGYLGKVVCPVKLLRKQSPLKRTGQSKVKRSIANTNKTNLRTIQNNLEPRFACRVCKKRFLYASTLQNHMVRGHKIVENLGVGCHLCGEFFLDHLELRKHHRMVHSPVTQEVEMKYTPPETEQTAQQSGLRAEPLPVRNQSRVKASHAHAEAPVDQSDAKSRFPCICGKRFSTTSSRGLHIRTKTIGKIFVCSYCPAATVRYDQYGNLKAHIKCTHPEIADKIDNFACGVCGKIFSRREQAKAHKKRVHRQRE